MPVFDSRIEQVLFSGENSFYILKLSVVDNPFEIIHAKGNLHGFIPKPGALFSFEGDWTVHPKFGRQLDIKRGPIFKKGGLDVDSVLGILAGENLPAIVYSALREVPPNELLDTLTDEVKLSALIGSDWGAIVKKAWLVSYDYLKVLQKLQEIGLPQSKIGLVWSHYGEEAASKIAENPWGLCRLPGIGLAIADNVATTLGFVPGNQPLRIEASTLTQLKACRGRGHLYLTASELLGLVDREIPDLTLETFAKSVKSLSDSREVVVDSTTRAGVKAIYEKKTYELERDSARMLRERIDRPVSTSYGESLTRYTKSQGTVAELAQVALDKYLPTQKWGFSEAQKQGILNALTQPVSILTGLPGTGKTTSLKAVVHIFEDLNLSFLLMAPTGIAAKRLSSVTGALASTIHRAFGGQVLVKDKQAGYAGVEGPKLDLEDEDDDSPPEGAWAYSPEDPHPADVVIVDESSMVDQQLLHRILFSTKPDCRIVFAGDAAQLPSVGPGDVLRSLIASNQIPSVNLKEIFRQATDNGIVLAAHAIHAGQTPHSSSDFQIIEIDNDENVAHEVVAIANHLEEMGIGHQVLSPRHQGSIGVTTLNQMLRETINPAGSASSEGKVGDTVIRQGDKVMVIKNDYQLKVFNGEVGIVTRIDKHTLDVTITGDDRTVTMATKQAAKRIRLAYACTVHKSQGLEYDAIVMPMTHSLHHQLQRNLIYTAITRAKKKVFLVGSRSALHRAALNGQVDTRNTLMKERLSGSNP